MNGQPNMISNKKLMRIGELSFKNAIRLTNPLKINAKTSFNQITIINDEILSLSFGKIYQIYGIENEMVTKFFTRGFFNEMQRSWPHKSIKAERYFKRVVKEFIKENKPLKIS